MFGTFLENSTKFTKNKLVHGLPLIRTDQFPVVYARIHASSPHLAGTPAQISMQRTLRLILLFSAILLACVSGCGGRHTRSVAVPGFVVVDDVVCIVHWCVEIVWQKERSLLVYITLKHQSTQIPYTHVMGNTVVDTFHLGGEDIIAKNEVVYFIHNDKIIFEKTFQELGIDLSRFKTDDFRELSDHTLRDYLQPILENLVREHVPPQDTETKTDRPHEEQDQTF